jgi:alpha-L-fucosidase
MNYILFLTKHHDGFCLWDTDTTEWKVTNAPLGRDVLAELRQSCEKYGLKLALYFSEGDWHWPHVGSDTEDKGGDDSFGYGASMKKQPRRLNPEMKKAQLRELCTRYGPIEFFWMDHAQGTGGLDHRATMEWVRTFQPNCFVGFNNGAPAGRICLRERGKAGPLGDPRAVHNARNLQKETKHPYLVVEFTYPILPKHKGGADWFYSLPRHDGLCRSAESIYADYLGAVKYGNIFSLNVGPNYEGRIRDIDVKTLREVGEMIRINAPMPEIEEEPVARKKTRKRGKKAKKKG